MTGSAQSTINRSSKNRLGLLLKQYYDDPALSLGSAGTESGDDYSLGRLEKLKSDALMARTVESLRSYKEAESDLRMLLYNNCDKLLKAVHVVCDIREGSREVETSAVQLEAIVSGKDDLLNTSTPGLCRYQQLLACRRVIECVESLESLCEIFIKNHDISAREKINIYLEIREQIFDSLAVRFPLIASIDTRLRSVVEGELVPLLMVGTDDKQARKSRVALLMDLFPRGHARHGEIMQQFVELEIASFDEKLRGIPLENPQETMANFNAIVSILFVCREFDDGELGVKILSDLVPQASSQIVKSIELYGNIGSCVDEVLDFIQTATNAHLRIPQVSNQVLETFSRSCLEAWIDFQFKSAARACVSEDLPPLLAASAFGACCDVIHTRCCTVIALANDAISRAGDDPCFPHVLDCVFGYYESVCQPVFSEEIFDTLVRSLKLAKFLTSRRTVDRTLNALAEIFASEEDVVERPVVVASAHAVIRLLGEWVGDSYERLERAVKEGLVPVLDVCAVMRPGKRQSELDSTEMVHSRKLLLPNPSSVFPTLDVGVLIVAALHFKALRESVLSGNPRSTAVPEWIERMVGGPQSEGCQILSAMARDTMVPDV